MERLLFYFPWILWLGVFFVLLNIISDVKRGDFVRSRATIIYLNIVAFLMLGGTAVIYFLFLTEGNNCNESRVINVIFSVGIVVNICHLLRILIKLIKKHDT